MSWLIWVYAGRTCNLVRNAGDDNKHNGLYPVIYNLNLQTGPFQISQSHITHSGDDSGLGHCNIKELLTYLNKVAALRVIKTL